MKQIANVAALPGIVGKSVGLPDIHSGYGFAIGNMAAFDMTNPDAVVSPGGVGFDINCGVRLIRTNLTERDVAPKKEQLTQALFDHIPVGVGSKGMIPMNAKDLDEALEMGMDWSLREGYVQLIYKYTYTICVSVPVTPKRLLKFAEELLQFSTKLDEIVRYFRIQR